MATRNKMVARVAKAARAGDKDAEALMHISFQAWAHEDLGNGSAKLWCGNHSYIYAEDGDEGFAQDLRTWMGEGELEDEKPPIVDSGRVCPSVLRKRGYQKLIHITAPMDVKVFMENTGVGVLPRHGVVWVSADIIMMLEEIRGLHTHEQMAAIKVFHEAGEEAREFFLEDPITAMEMYKAAKE